MNTNSLVYRPNAGFSLAEMAIVLFLMGIAMTMGLKMVIANLDNGAYSETKAKQERIKIALIGYLRTNRWLPCPNSGTPWDGAEDRPNTPGGATPTTTCLGNNGRGVVPWQVLNLSRDSVQDGWGNFFTYRVANNTPGGAAGSNWTIRGGANAFDIGELTASPVTLTVTERDEAGVLGAPISGVIVVIVSHGKNGLGARTVKGNLNTLPVATTDEGINAAATTSFIRRAFTEVQVPVIGAYDDLVAYMTPQDLLQPLINEKTLIGVCQAYCPACPPAPALPAGTIINPGPGCNATNVPVGDDVFTCPGIPTFCP